MGAILSIAAKRGTTAGIIGTCGCLSPAIVRYLAICTKGGLRQLQELLGRQKLPLIYLE